MVVGGEGQDHLIMDGFDAMTDQIVGFETGVSGDILDISNILDGYNPFTEVLSDFVLMFANEGDTTFFVNADGDLGGGYDAVVVLQDIVLNDINALINDGNLIV